MAAHSNETVYPRDGVEAGPSGLVLIAIFDTTQILGLLLLTAVLLTAGLSGAIRRSPAWYNFLITWIISCASYLVILGQQTGPEPHFPTCLFQAMLIYAAPAVMVTAGLCFSIEMWRLVRRTTTERQSESQRSNIILLAFPYFVHLLVCVEVLVLGLKNPAQVRRDQTSMFCHLEQTIEHSIPPKITGCVVILATIIAITFVVSTAIHIRRHWSAFRLLQIRQATNIHKMVIRFSIFALLPTFGLALSIAQISTSVSATEDGILTIIVGTLPVGAALIFGTQSDLTSIWIFWRKGSNAGSTNPELRKPADISGVKLSTAASV